MYGIKNVVFIIFSKSASEPLQNMWRVFLHLSVRESRSFKRFQHITSWRSQSEISAQTFYSRIMQWSFMSNFFLNLLNSSSVCRLWREPLQKSATGSLICSNSLDEWCGHSGVKHLQPFFLFWFHCSHRCSVEISGGDFLPPSVWLQVWHGFNNWYLMYYCSKSWRFLLKRPVQPRCSA